MNENLITLTGCGSVHVVPDVTRIELKLASLHESYEEAYTQAKENTDALVGIMNEVKLDPKLPKTNSLDINKKFESQYDKKHEYVGDKFVGFQLNHRVKIDLGIDNVLLNSIVKLIGQRLKQAEIDISYTVKDPRPAQLKMLERAVKDAKEKAEIMTQALGCKLGPVKEINYGVQEIHIYSQARNIHNAEEAMCCQAESLDITPDDLSASDKVTVVWYLANDGKKS